MRAVRTSCYLAFTFCLVCSPQSAPNLTPRDLFLDKSGDGLGSANQPANSQGPAQVKTAPVADGQRNRSRKPFAVCYRVLSRSQNGFVGVDAGSTVFHDGDSVRLNLNANQDSYFYVMQKGKNGQWKALFPQPGMDADANHLKAYDGGDFPVSPGVFTFNDDPGIEEVFVIFSPTRDVSLAQLNEASMVTEGVADDTPRNANGTLMARRDLIFQKVEETNENRPGLATYVSFRDQSATGPVILKIRLRHEPRAK